MIAALDTNSAAQSDVSAANDPSWLPDDWRYIPLRSVCEKTSIWNPARDPRDRLRYIDVSSVSNEHFSVTGAQEVLGSNAPSRARKIVKAGDVIYATVRPSLKRVAWIEPRYDDQIASTAFCIVRADPKQAVSKFLYYVMLSDDVNRKIIEHERGASYPAVTDKDVLNQVVSLPPLLEQEKIAAVLWKIQKAVEIEDAIVRNARDLKKSLLRRLFTHGLRGEPLKETEIGPLPESWEVLTAEKIFKLSSGETRPKQLSDLRSDASRFPVFGGNGIMGYSTEHNVSVRSLVIGRVGEYCGAVHIAPAPFWVTDNALYSKEWFNREISIDYVAAFLSFYDLNRFRRKSSQPLVSQGTIHEVLIPLAEREERDEIANILQTVDRKIDIHESKKRSLQDLFKTMLHELMTAQIRVKDLDIDTSEVE